MDDVALITEPRRREILWYIWDGERSAGEIAGRFDDVTFGAVSQHLAKLRDAGFVRVRAEGNRRFYSVDKEGLGTLRPMLEAMWSAVLDDLATAVERESDG